MVSEDTDITRTDVLRAHEKFHGPQYSAVADAPTKEGLVFWVDGSGADAAGYYARTNGQVSGPFGGPSNLPDTESAGSDVATNTEIVNYGDYLDAAVDPNNAKRVTADIDTGATDERYLRRVEDSFDTRDTTTGPSADPPSAPTTWAFVPGSGPADATGGWFYGDTPPSTESRRSFGCDFTITTAPDGSTVLSGTWALEKEYRVGSGGGDLRVEARTQPMAAYSAYDDATSHTSDESFVGEDDAFIEVRPYDSSLQPLDVGITTQYSRTASHQAFADGGTADLGGDEWVSFGHTAALPAATVYVEVVLQTADTPNTWETRGTVGGGNAALLVDDFRAEYTSGLQPSGVLEHDHDERYLEDAPGAVAPNNLQFDPATQNELDAHDHAGDAIGDSSPVASINTEQASITDGAVISGDAGGAGYNYAGLKIRGGIPAIEFYDDDSPPHVVVRTQDGELKRFVDDNGNGGYGVRTELYHEGNLDNISPDRVNGVATRTAANDNHRSNDQTDLFSISTDTDSYDGYGVWLDISLNNGAGVGYTRFFTGKPYGTDEAPQITKIDSGGGSPFSTLSASVDGSNNITISQDGSGADSGQQVRLIARDDDTDVTISTL